MTIETTSTDLQGGLLIAGPSLQDPNFHRMVVLMISHDENGSLGVVLGPSSPATAKELCAAMGLTWTRADSPELRYGGPCEPGRIFILHGGAEPLEQAVTLAPGVHLGSSVPLLRDLIEKPEVPVALFSGYAGWGPGQMEREMQESSWLPGDCPPELLFDTPPDEIWEAALRTINVSPQMIVTGKGGSA